MAVTVFAAGSLVAVALLALLIASIVHQPLRIWPTPGPKTWQSYVFWPLFRGLNCSCVAMAVLDHENWLGIPGVFRFLAFAVAVASTALFAYSFRLLGRDNSYGAQDGLVTHGIYRWSRNPQNAMLMVFYAALAIAAASQAAVALCIAMVVVYYLMVLLEEPWLERSYGDPYRAYCRQVPRFFNWRRLLDVTSPHGIRS